MREYGPVRRTVSVIARLVAVAGAQQLARVFVVVGGLGIEARVQVPRFTVYWVLWIYTCFSGVGRVWQSTRCLQFPMSELIEVRSGVRCSRVLLRGRVDSLACT